MNTTKKKLEALNQETHDLVDNWIEDEAYFANNRDDEIALLVSLNKETEALNREIVIEEAAAWLGPKWFCIAIGWVQPLNDNELKQATIIYEQYRAMPRLSSSGHMAKIRRFTQMKINNRL